MREKFDVLAAKALAGEASAEDQADLKALLAANPDLQVEFNRLQKMGELLRDAGPLAAGLEVAAAPLSIERRKELQRALRAKFGRWPNGLPDEALSSVPEISRPAFRRWWGSGFARAWLGAGALAAILVAAIAFWQSQTSDQVKTGNRIIAYLLLEQGDAQLRRAGRSQQIDQLATLRDGDELSLAVNTRVSAIASSGNIALTNSGRIQADDLLNRRSKEQTQAGTERQKSFRIALFEAKTNLSNAGLLVTTRTALGISLYSPLAATASLTPDFVWKSEPGKTYDVTVTDELNSKTPSWMISGAVPPLQFRQLVGGQDRPLIPAGLYRVQVSVTGEPLTASTYTFRTTADAPCHVPASDVAKLTEASELLSGGSGRIGDALADLITLHEPLASSELALRLKLLAFGKTGYHQEFDAVLAKLNGRP